jgi:hypothetical protein
LGDPGAGKTTAFEHEAKASGSSQYVTARDLLTFDDRPEWHDKTLFIDGLDEVRAGSNDARTPFDIIRATLEKLDRPRFRLSCREADWFGASDREHLSKVAPEGTEILELHLDPLTENQIRKILTHDERVPDPSEFMREAQSRNLIDLIRNPQILHMLITAVSGGEKWPESRRETFELACRTLVIEHNQEHSVADWTYPVDLEGQLDAAGFLCSVLLIAGKGGYSLLPTVVEESYPSIDELDHNDPHILRRVAKTKLFILFNERAAPLHRSAAEYLGARYLRKRIEDQGLPVSRLLALLTGEDGTVVSDLRGLFAWLTALCNQERSILIEHDPLGVVIYGDVRDFSRPDKRRILDSLHSEADRYEGFRSGDWTEQPFGALCTPDMEPVFREILESPDRSDAYQVLVDCVLDAMAYGTPLPGLCDCMINIIRDLRWWPRNRYQALKVYIRIEEDQGVRTGQLLGFLKDINRNIIPDPDDELRGRLLEVLYPDYVGPSVVFDNLHLPKDPNYIGTYVGFWSHYLVDTSSDAEVAELLDELVTRQGVLMSVLEDHHFRSMTGKLLIRGLDSCGSDLDPRRLYGWLGLGLDQHGYPSLEHKRQYKRVREWLENHSELQKAIIRSSLRECSKSERFNICMRKATRRLFNARHPPDYGMWCLQNAKKASSEAEAKYLLREAVGVLTLPDVGGGLTLELLEQAAEEQPRLKPWLGELLWCPLDQENQKFAIEQNQRRREREKQKREWTQMIKSHETVITDGTARPNLLDTLATAYFGYFIDAKGETPQERLRDFLNGDEDLVQSTVVGFRNCLQRSDLPEVADIIKLHIDGRRYLLSRPFRAGLDELSRGSPRRICELGEDRMRTALAFHFTEAVGEEPAWYKELVRSKPALVANVLVEYGTALMRTGKEHVTGIYSVAYDEVHAQVAREAALPLLTAFPVRCTTKQFSSLDYLLKAALRYADPGELLGLIRKKLTAKSMNVAQRVRWLTTGLIADPSCYEQKLAEYVARSESRVKHLAGFLSNRTEQWSPYTQLPESTLGLLIRLLGTRYTPYRISGSSFVSPSMEVSDVVGKLIARLGAIPTELATNELEKLIEMDELPEWNKTLRRALYHQLARRREANFLHPNVQQVNRTLQNSEPANVADLVALTLDHIRDLSKRIRDTNTNDYKQYWNLDERGKPVNRRHEEACRDAFLSDLRDRLAPQNVDVQPEGQYAENKRADIRVSVGGADGFNVPIEIKCNDHRDLWHAMHSQLKSKYTRDPGAYGYGVYLVFWFGTGCTPPPPEGTSPKTAVELESRLQATLTSREEQRQISIAVIDCSVPVQK